MTLRTLIQSVDGWQTKTAAEIHSALAAMTVEVRDDQLYTWAGVALLIGPQNAEGLRLALEGSGLGWAVHQLGGSGIQLSHDSTQALLTALAAVPGATTLRERGMHSEPVTDATLAEVEVELRAIRRDEREGEVLDQVQAWREAMTLWVANGGTEPQL